MFEGKDEEETGRWRTGGGMFREVFCRSRKAEVGQSR